MPTFNIVRKSKIENSFRVQQIRGMFDYSKECVVHKWEGEIPYESKKWSIGLIVGASGSGKTTIATTAFPDFHVHEKFSWPKSKSVVDGFDSSLSIKDITGMLNSVGFSSPPHWLKPFSHLSNGQKFRAELARCLLLKSKGIVFDEFTSVVDRTVAKIGCAAISKTLRRKGSPPFIAVSCHYDIIEWLDPDWIFDMETQTFEWRERRRFPEIKIKVHKTPRDSWRLFREHHYLDTTLNKAAVTFIAMWGITPVAFCSAVHFPHLSSTKLKREHRTVVLPDFQGVGIGNLVSEFVGSYFKSLGFRFISVTSAPAMIYHRNKSNKWTTKRIGKVSGSGNHRLQASSSCSRITAGFEYVGD